VSTDTPVAGSAAVSNAARGLALAALPASAAAAVVAEAAAEAAAAVPPSLGPLSLLQYAVDVPVIGEREKVSSDSPLRRDIFAFRSIGNGFHSRDVLAPWLSDEHTWQLARPSRMRSRPAQVSSGNSNSHIALKVFVCQE
jgi:hypothetical protein